MTLRLTRRALAVLPFLLAACADDEPPGPGRRDFPPLRYGYLPTVNLNVQRVAIGEGFIPPGSDAEVSGYSPAKLADTLIAMARDRLKPVGAGGTATFQILTASITRRNDTLNGLLAVRLDVRDADDANLGFAEARVTANHTGPIPDLRAAAYDMLKSMMDDMNVELEFQLRNKLRAWIVDPPGATPRPDPSTTLPPPPPPPPRS
jgi:hypothetical protein